MLDSHTYRHYLGVKADKTGMSILDIHEKLLEKGLTPRPGLTTWGHTRRLVRRSPIRIGDSMHCVIFVRGMLF